MDARQVSAWDGSGQASTAARSHHHRQPVAMRLGPLPMHGDEGVVVRLL